MNRVEMEPFARLWIGHWNARDIDAVLDTFVDDARFISPLAAEVMGSPVVQGKSAMRQYWQKALEQTHSLHFSLIDAICDLERQTLVVQYRAERNGKVTRAAEAMRFQGRWQVEGEALYGAPL